MSNRSNKAGAYIDTPLENLVAETQMPTRWLASEDNLAFWREVCKRVPNRAPAAYRLVRQLWNRDHHQELETLLPRLMEKFPRYIEIKLHWIELAMLMEARDEAERRLQVCQAQFPEDKKLKAIAYRIAIERGAFARAADIAFDIVRNSGVAAFEWQARLALHYAKTVADWAAFPPPRDYKTYTINLDTDHDRLRRLQLRLAAKNLAAERIPGVQGSYLPDTASLLLTKGASKQMKGTLGCFLSHIRAWEACVTGPEPFAFIIEDDAAFTLPPPSHRRLEHSRE